VFLGAKQYTPDWEVIGGSIPLTEAQLQQQVRHVMAVLGYTVIEVGKTRAKLKCAKCGSMAHATGWQGNTPGAPDLYFHASWWKHPVAIAVELKTKGGRVREQQKHLADSGMTKVCRSLKSVLDVVKAYEIEYGSDIVVDQIERFEQLNGHILDVG
jgi:hypothetical protein